MPAGACDSVKYWESNLSREKTKNQWQESVRPKTKSRCHKAQPLRRPAARQLHPIKCTPPRPPLSSPPPSPSPLLLRLFPSRPTKRSLPWLTRIGKPAVIRAERRKKTGSAPRQSSAALLNPSPRSFAVFSPKNRAICPGLRGRVPDFRPDAALPGGAVITLRKPLRPPVNGVVGS